MNHMYLKVGGSPYSGDKLERNPYEGDTFAAGEGSRDVPSQCVRARFFHDIQTNIQKG